MDATCVTGARRSTGLAAVSTDVRLADHLGVEFLADAKRDFGCVEVGQSAVQARFGLRGVRRRNVAGIESFLVVAWISRSTWTLVRCAS